MNQLSRNEIFAFGLRTDLLKAVVLTFCPKPLKKKKRSFLFGEITLNGMDTLLLYF